MIRRGAVCTMVGLIAAVSGILLMASPASAHSGTVGFTCDTITIYLSGFDSNAPNILTVTVTVPANPAQNYTQTITFDNPSGSGDFTVARPQPAGPVDVAWTAGQAPPAPQFSGSGTDNGIDCGTTPTTQAPTTSTTPPTTAVTPSTEVTPTTTGTPNVPLFPVVTTTTAPATTTTAPATTTSTPNNPAVLPVTASPTTLANGSSNLPATGPGTTGRLPFTGGPRGGLPITGVVLLVVGALFLAIARFRPARG